MNWALPMAGAASGLIAGSFLSTLAIRWGRGDRVSRGRSQCDACGRIVTAALLVPLVGYALTRGRCRACGERIDPRHPLMEFGCAAIGLLAFATHPGGAGAAGALFGWLLLALAVLDHDYFWLPDRLTLPLAICGLACGLVGVPPEPAAHAIGALAGWLGMMALAWAYHRLRGREGLGQGDAKLLGAIGSWLGWRALPWVLLGASALGLSICLVLAARGRPIALTDRLPLGSLLSVAAWLIWLLLPPDCL